jgi:hypothetical protein
VVQQNSLGAPFDPDPDDELPNDPPITEEYLRDSVEDVELSWPDDNPQDAPAGGIDQLSEAVKDDMPGPNAQDAINRGLRSPNERTGDNQFDKRYFDVEDNPDLGVKSQNGQTVEDRVTEEELQVDRTSDDDPDIEQRIG